VRDNRKALNVWCRRLQTFCLTAYYGSLRADDMGRAVRAVALSAVKGHQWSAPVSQAFDASKSLTALEQDRTIIAVIELSQSKWLAAAVVPGVKRQPLKKLDADAESLFKLLHRWRKVFRRRNDETLPHSGGRRRKSAKARSRGKLGTGWVAGAMGI
jgi:hypothetical protein